MVIVYTLVAPWRVEQWCKQSPFALTQSPVTSAGAPAHQLCILSPYLCCFV
jgi:hypothetical protein